MERIIGKFRGMPSQEKVVRLLLARGFQVDENGHVVSGKIEIPHTQIAKEVGVNHARRGCDHRDDTKGRRRSSVC